MTSLPRAYVGLKGGRRPHTSSYAEIRDAKLIVGIHDMSPETEEALGRECIWELAVHETDKDQLLLRLIADRFVDYDDATAWLNAQKIPFTTRFDPDA